MHFTTAEAQLVFGFFASVIVPIVVSLIARFETSATAKFLLAVAASVVGAVLSQYAAGELSGGSLVVAALGVFAASQAHFGTWFKGLGLDEYLLSLGSAKRGP
jgi:hypothetical protein